MFIHVEPVAEEVVYVVTEPQEQPEQAQEEICEDPAQGPVNPNAEQQPEGIKFLRVEWNPSCMIPRFHWSKY